MHLTACGGGDRRTPPLADAGLRSDATTVIDGGSSSPSDDALRYCMLLMSCAYEMVGGAAACVRDVQLSLASGAAAGFIEDARDIPRQVACAASADSCTTMLECRALGRSAGFCTGREAAFCDGDVAVLCRSEEYPAFVLDCAAIGLSCHSIRESAAACTNGVTCDASAPRCDGRSRTYCVDGMEAPIDCGLVWPGGSCALVADERGLPTPTCVPPGADCSADRCAGSTLIRCIGGHELPVDCAAAVEGSCVDGTDGPECMPTATECDARSMEACDGDRVQVCVNGRYEAIDCRELGMRTCGVHISGGARCVP
jgi:hypothetical protein